MSFAAGREETSCSPFPCGEKFEAFFFRTRNLRKEAFEGREASAFVVGTPLAVLPPGATTGLGRDIRKGREQTPGGLA